MAIKIIVPTTPVTDAWYPAMCLGAPLNLKKSKLFNLDESEQQDLLLLASEDASSRCDIVFDVIFSSSFFFSVGHFYFFACF